MIEILVSLKLSERLLRARLNLTSVRQLLVVSSVGLALINGVWGQGTSQVEQESIRLSREYILEQLSHIRTSYRFASQSFRQAQVLLLADLLLTGNVFRGNRQGSTTHPKARAYQAAQGEMLKRVVNQPALALGMLKEEPPHKGRRRSSFEKVLDVFMETLEKGDPSRNK